MFYRKNIRHLTKATDLGKVFITVLFILTFLLIFFNKADYIVVNKIKSISTDVVSPITRVVTSPVRFTSDTINKILQVCLITFPMCGNNFI